MTTYYKQVEINNASTDLNYLYIYISEYSTAMYFDTLI